ncbi:MAG: T9SS type A sorting domain-containing protein [Ignavibacteriae bacterium]|nr:T9SS type A sorting domain-containing protein [Ignavibacteriota bacterium]
MSPRTVPGFLLLLSLPLCLHAQWSGMPDVNNPVCLADSSQRNIDMVSDGRGGSILVWEDDRGTSGSPDIYAQRMSAIGIPKWGVDGTPVCIMPGAQKRPRIISDGAGGVIAVWDDTRNGDADLYAQRLDSSGVPCWSLNGVPVITVSWSQQYPALASDGQGGAIVVWQDTRSTGFTIYAQHLASTGMILWGDAGRRVSGGSQAAVLPQVLADGMKGAVIVWEDGRAPSSGADIYAQRIDSVGALLWNADGVPLCTATGAQKSPRIAPVSSAGACIVWQDQRASATMSDIYAQLIDSAGRVQWLSNGLAICKASDNQFSPEIVSDGAGGAIIAWLDARFGYTVRPFAQRLNPAGNLLWQLNGYDLCPSAQDADHLRLSPDGSNGVVVAWADNRSGNYNIYAQRIESGGSRVWGAAGVAVCVASGDQLDVELTATGMGGWILAWIDLRGGRVFTDIYASYLYAGGFIPVRLLSFTAEEEAGAAVLRWITETECLNAGFDIQRSHDGETWTSIGFAEGSASCSIGRSYEFIDPLPLSRHPLGDILYRLRQIDYDGHSTMLPFARLVYAPRVESIVISAAPNPAAGRTSLAVFFPRRMDATVRLHDACGRLVTTLLEATPVERGARHFSFDVSSLPCGVYFLTAESGASAAVHRLVRGD